jgi:hypothetical protein
MESCAKCGTSVFATETQCIRCGQPTPAGVRAAQARAQAQAAMGPPAFLPPPPRLRVGVAKRVGMFTVTCCVAVVVLVASLARSGILFTRWTTRSSPLEIATLELPDRCAFYGSVHEPGTDAAEIDCMPSESSKFVIEVTDVKLTSPTTDFGTYGRSLIQQRLGSAITSPRRVTTPTGPAYDLYGTGHLGDRAIRYKARVFDIGGGLVLVAGFGDANSRYLEADYERAIRSVRAAGTA